MRVVIRHTNVTKCHRVESYAGVRSEHEVWQECIWLWRSGPPIPMSLFQVCPNNHLCYDN